MDEVQFDDDLFSRNLVEFITVLKITSKVVVSKDILSETDFDLEKYIETESKENVWNHMQEMTREEFDSLVLFIKRVE